VKAHHAWCCPRCPRKPEPKLTALERATLLRDLDVKVNHMRNLVALARNARLKTWELDSKLRAEWLRIASDLRRLKE
jgi:hypothetical protein